MKLSNLNKLVILVVMLFITVVFVELNRNKFLHLSNKPIVQNGYIDIDDKYLNQNKLVPLDGQWEFYWRELLRPIDIDENQYEKKYINIPNQIIKKSINNEVVTANGYATFRLNIKVHDISKLYGLKFNYFSSSCKVWINGKFVSSSGEVGSNKNSYKPQYVPLEILFTTYTENIEVVIQVANFHHRRMVLNEVLFGTADDIIHNTYMNIIKESMLFGSLLLISIYFAVLYFIHRKNLIVIYLSLISLVAAIRESVIGERIIIRIFPNLPAEIMTKLGYLPTFILLPLFILYIRSILKLCKLNKMAVISKYVSILSVIIIVIFPVKVYDYIFQYGSWIIIASAIYVIYIIFYSGFTEKTKESNIMCIGTVFVLITAINDILREFGIIKSPELLSIGIDAFIIIQAIFLAWRFNENFQKTMELAQENEFMYGKIQELNRNLENKIEDRTKQLEIANKRLNKISKTDSLTGLINRRYFDELLQKEWCKSLEKKQPLSIIMMDIDFFKGYNDIYGHLQGDECLKKVANCIKSSVRGEIDKVIRYGGEEFMVLSPNTNSCIAFTMAENIRKNIKSLKIPHRASSIDEYVTLSLGINTIIVSEKDIKEDFVNNSDKALYLAKEKGRNCVKVSDSLIKHHNN